MVEDYVGLDVRVKFGDSRSNGSQDIQAADFVSQLLSKRILNKVNNFVCILCKNVNELLLSYGNAKLLCHNYNI